MKLRYHVEKDGAKNRYHKIGIKTVVLMYTISQLIQAFIRLKHLDYHVPYLNMATQKQEKKEETFRKNEEISG